jgi:photosystem II reaction center protein Psb28
MSGLGTCLSIAVHDMGQCSPHTVRVVLTVREGCTEGQGKMCAATMKFQQPSVFEADNSLGEITGLYMMDEEGEISTVDVNAKFVNGKPSVIECRHIMRTALEWDRFMRFMERYAEENNLGFAGVRPHCVTWPPSVHRLQALHRLLMAALQYCMWHVHAMIRCLQAPVLREGLLKAWRVQ